MTRTLNFTVLRILAGMKVVTLCKGHVPSARRRQVFTAPAPKGIPSPAFTYATLQVEGIASSDIASVRHLRTGSPRLLETGGKGGGMKRKHEPQGEVAGGRGGVSVGG